MPKNQTSSHKNVSPMVLINKWLS